MNHESEEQYKAFCKEALAAQHLVVEKKDACATEKMQIDSSSFAQKKQVPKQSTGLTLKNGYVSNYPSLDSISQIALTNNWVPEYNDLVNAMKRAFETQWAKASPEEKNGPELKIDNQQSNQQENT